MPEGTIQSVNRQKEWNGSYGPMVDYYLTLNSGEWEGEVYLTKKADSPAPQPGDTFEFEKVKQDSHGIKIKRVYEGGGGGFSGASGGGVTADSRQESIQRQTALKAAVEVYAHHPDHPDPLPLADKFLGWITASDPKPSTGADTDGLAVAEDGFGGSAEPVSVGGADSDIPFAPSRI